MYTVDLHLKNETVATAVYNLKEQMKLAKRSKERIVCFIVGYGSTGGSHKIRNAILELLKEFKEKKQIKDYIIGSDIDMFKTNYQAFLGKALLDEECRRRKNPGEVLVVL